MLVSNTARVMYVVCACSYELLETGPKRMENDGLNSLHYEIKVFEKLPLYTRILAHIDETTVSLVVRRYFCLSVD